MKRIKICTFITAIMLLSAPMAQAQSPVVNTLNEHSPVEITSLSGSLVLGKVEGSLKPLQEKLADGTYKTITTVNVVLLDPSKPTQLVEFAFQTLSFSYEEDVFVRLDKEGVSLTQTSNGHTLSVPRFGPGLSNDYSLISPQKVETAKPVERDGKYYTASRAVTGFENKSDGLVVYTKEEMLCVETNSSLDRPCDTDVDKFEGRPQRVAAVGMVNGF